MNYKGIIFDLDGTLVNSLEDLHECMNKVLTNLGLPTHKLETYKGSIGKGIKHLVYRALPASHQNEEDVDKSYKSMMEIYNKNFINKTKPYDGIIELLNELKKRDIKLCVLSNKVDEFTKKIIQAFFPDTFDIVMGLGDEEYKKPSPFGVLKICEKLAIKANEMLYVGDTNIDIETAKNASMQSAGVVWGFRPKKELVLSNATYIINEPSELFNIL